MTMERTAAKIGRRMKKWEKFIVASGEFARPPRRPGRTRIRPSTMTCSPGFQALLHDPQAVDHRADLHRAKLDLLLRVDDIDELLRLVRAERAVGNQQRRIFAAAGNAHARKEARAKRAIRIGKHAAAAHRARGRDQPCCPRNPCSPCAGSPPRPPAPSRPGSGLSRALTRLPSRRSWMYFKIERSSAST